MRVVIDTGILIAALITRDTPPDRIYQAWRKQRFERVTSEWQLEEFRRVSRFSSTNDLNIAPWEKELARDQIRESGDGVLGRSSSSVQ